jgi:hypothetical protein
MSIKVKPAARPSPSLAVSAELFNFSLWGLPTALSVDLGYRHTNDGTAGGGKLKDKGQFKLGSRCVASTGNFGFDLGLDVRYETMSVSSHYVPDSSFSTVRPWGSISARYNFFEDIGNRGNKYSLFAGLEVVMPLSGFKVSKDDYYRDYAIVTNRFQLGNVPTVSESLSSYTKAHMPKFEVGVYLGVRFGS